MKTKQAIINLSPYDFLAVDFAENRSNEIHLTIERFRKATPTTAPKNLGLPIFLNFAQAEELTNHLRKAIRFLSKPTKREG